MKYQVVVVHVYAFEPHGVVFDTLYTNLIHSQKIGLL